MSIVHESVCVQARVTIRPCVEVGEITVVPIRNAVIGRCYGQLTECCSFMVSKQICVQVPLEFSAIAAVEPAGIVCGTPRHGPCPLVPSVYEEDVEVLNPEETDHGHRHC